MNQIETAGVLRGAALQPFRRSVRGDPGGLTTLGSPFLQVTSVCHAHAVFSAMQAGHEAECTAYVQEVWTDMRPLSPRRKMDAAGG